MIVKKSLLVSDACNALRVVIAVLPVCLPANTCIRFLELRNNSVCQSSAIKSSDAAKATASVGISGAGGFMTVSSIIARRASCVRNLLLDLLIR